MQFKNPLAAAAAWAERLSDPETVNARRQQKQQQEARQRREQEAEQPPVPEAESISDAPPSPITPPAAEDTQKSAEERRSAIWALCIMLGVVSSVVAFFIGMIR